LPHASPADPPFRSAAAPEAPAVRLP
jgi:hypothetical protein